MTGYTKLFSSIVTSSIWTEDDRTRIVWITMLALSDQHGEVQASIPGLARIAAVSVEDCEAAIAKFLAPDPYSRTKDDDGRRIETIEGGWSLLNHAKYREAMSHEDRKEKSKIRKQRQRDRAKRDASHKKRDERDQRDMSQAGRDESRMSLHTEAKADSESKTNTEGDKTNIEDLKLTNDLPKKEKAKFMKPTQEQAELHAAKLGLPLTEVVKFIAFYDSNGWKVGRNKMKSWQAAMVNWRSNYQERAAKYEKPIKPVEGSEPKNGF